MQRSANKGKNRKDPSPCEFLLTGPGGEDVKMKLLGYSEVRDDVFAVCRPSDDPDDAKAAVFHMSLSGDSVRFELVTDRKVCMEAVDALADKLLK